MSRRRIADGGPRQPRCCYVATVEGTERGVFFRVFFKRMDAAQRTARQTGGTLQDLVTLKRYRFVRGQMMEV